HSLPDQLRTLIFDFSLPQSGQVISFQVEGTCGRYAVASRPPVVPIATRLYLANTVNLTVYSLRSDYFRHDTETLTQQLAGRSPRAASGSCLGISASVWCRASCVRQGNAR